MAKFEPGGIHETEREYPEIMTANQVASYLGFEAKTIHNWTSDGKIPHKKIGGSPRYLKSEIDDALKGDTLGRKKRGSGKQAKRRKS